MARVKIDFPSRAPNFTVSIPVRITDLNYGNHLANDKLVSLLHEVRVAYLSALGFTEFDIAGKSIIQADLMVAYKGEGFYGDVVDIDLFVENLSQRAFDMLYRISTLRNGERFPIAEAKVAIVFFDYENRKIAETPSLFIDKINTPISCPN